MFFTLLLLVSGLTGHPFARTHRQSEKATQDAKTADLVERIERGDDPNALLEAGRTGNLAFVPYLRERLRHDVSRHDPLKSEAQMALAKLDQRDQLQAIYCQVAVGNESQVAETMSELEYVGGWFSVRILNAILSDQLAANPRVDTHAPVDAQLVPPKLSATSILDRLFPAAGYQRTPENLFSFWMEYIPAHQEELRKLKPTGEGVTFSPAACKDGKPRKKLT